MSGLIIVDSPERARLLSRRNLPVAVDVAKDPVEVIVNWDAQPVRPEQWADAFILNRPEAVALANDSVERRRLWRAFRLEDATRRRFSEWYRVHVFDMRAISVYKGFRKASRRRFKRVLGRGKEVQKITEAAIRSLYALRLDFGIVDLVPRDDTFAILDLQLSPPVQGKTSIAYAKAIRRFFLRWQQAGTDFLIGADPEFLVCSRGPRKSVVVASQYLSREGALGVDNQRIQGTTSARPIVEVRPPPAREPHVLVRSLRRLLKMMPLPLRRRHLGWYAGSGPVAAYSVGGHIHFSGIPLTAGLLRAMDVYLAIPVLLLEDPVKARRRRRRYGGLGEMRLKKWGFEYRTLPSWLVAPRFAEAVLCLAKLIGWNWQSLSYDPFLEPQLTLDFYECRKASFYEIFDRIWTDLQSLPQYKPYGDVLSLIPNLVHRRLRWKEERDFRLEWGLR